jgi:hypothetical protein
MQRRHIGGLAIATCVLAVAATVLAQKPSPDKADPLVGTWKMRAEMKDGKPVSSYTIIFEPLPNGEKRRSFGVNAQGQKTASSYTAYCDGKDYPITGNPGVDMVEVRCIDSHTRDRINKKGGKVLSTARRVVSADGKTMTVTTTRPGPDGKPVVSQTVYDRQ